MPAASPLLGTLLVRHGVTSAKSVETSLDTAGTSACATKCIKKAGRLVAARLFRFTGSGYLTNTEMVPLTVWPPGPYAVKVYTELVIGVTVKLPLTGRVCAPISLPIRTTRSEEHTSELQSLRHLVCR